MPDLNRLIRPLAVIAWLHAAWQVLAVLLISVLFWLMLSLFRDMALFARSGGW